MSVQTWIHCDNCDSRVGMHPGEEPHQVQRELRVRGWHCALPGGRDLCPRCAEAKRREERTIPKPDPLVGMIGPWRAVEGNYVPLGCTCKYDHRGKGSTLKRRLRGDCPVHDRREKGKKHGN